MNIREHIERERQEEAERLRILEAGLPMDPWMAADFAVDCGLSDRLPSILYRTWQRGGIEDLQPALWAVWVHNKSHLGRAWENASGSNSSRRLASRW